MAKIGDLRVDMSVDSKGVTKGLQDAQAKISKASSNISKIVSDSSNDAVKQLSAPMSEITGVMKDQLAVVQQQTKSIVDQMNAAFSKATFADKMKEMTEYDMGSSWDAHAKDILEFVDALTRMGLITQQMSSRLKAFSFSMYDAGYSVSELKEGILHCLYVLEQMSRGASRGSSNLRLYAASIGAASTAMQKMLNAGASYNKLQIGSGQLTTYMNPGAIIEVNQALTLFRSTGINAASSVQSAFNKLWRNMKTKGVSALKNFVTQCDQVASKGGLISKIWKSAGNIIQGIVISQSFYNGLNKIQSAAGAVFEFSNHVEDATTALGGMFRDTDKAERLTTVLQEFAAETAFSFEQATSGARQLLAYGIQSKNLLTIMRPLSDAAAASGDMNTFDSIARAIGQIHTKGKLATEEILQLTEAGIPAFQILKEEMGLTRKELEDIGKSGVSSTKAINALISGMEKRYAGVGDLMQSTTTGLIDMLKDNLLIIGNAAFTPMFKGFKETLRKMAVAVDGWRKTVSKVGFAGLIQSLVSPEVFEQIQLLLSYLKIMKQNFQILMQAVGPIVKEFAKLALTVANLLLPVLAVFTRLLASLAYYITNSTPAVKYLVAVLGGLLVAKLATTWMLALTAAVKSLWVCKFIAKAVMLLVSTIRLLSVTMMKSPWIAMLGIAAGGLTALAVSSDKAKKSITGIGSKIAEVFGIDTTKTFAPTTNKNTASAEEFSEALDMAGESMEGLGDKAKKAGKKAQNALMSFDEVFNLSDPLDEAEDELDDAFDLGDMVVGDVDFGNLEDVGTLKLTDIAKNLVSVFGTTFKNSLIGLGIGAIIGGVIGGLIGGPSGALLGAKIGALAGGLVGMFWESLSQEFKNAAVGAGIGAGLGAAIGAFFGGPLGAGIGAALGAVAGSLVGYFWEQMTKNFTASTGIGAGVGATIGGLFGFVFGGPIGAGIGAALGAVAGALVVNFWEDIKRQFEGSKGIGSMAGFTAGGLIGLVLGGPIGAAVGALLGGIVGNLVGKFWPQITDWTSGAWSWMTVKCTEGWTNIAGFFSSGWESIKTNTSKGWDNIKTKTSEGWDKTKTYFSTGWENVKNNTSEGWETLKTKTASGWESLKTKTSTGWENTKTAFATGWDNLKTGASAGWEKLKTSWSTGWENLKAGTSRGWETTKTTFGTGWENLKTNTSNGWNNLKTNWDTGWNNVKTTTSSGWETTKSAFSTGWSNLKTDTSSSWDNLKNSWSTGWSNLKSGTGTGWSGLTSAFSSNWSTLKSNTSGGWDSLKTNWSSGWSSLASGTRSGWSGVQSTFTGIVSYLSGSFSNSWASVWRGLVTVFKNIMNGLGTAIKAPLNLVIDSVNWVIEGLNKISFKTPDWVPGVGGKQFGVNVGRVPRLAKGGLITKNTYAELGEGNKHEAVIPLENGTAIDQISSRIAQGLGPALAREMGAVLAQQNTTGTESDLQPLYVGTLIADDRGLRELERKMQIIRTGEQRRRG